MIILFHDLCMSEESMLMLHFVKKYRLEGPQYYLMISLNSNLGDQVSTAQHQRLELKIKELETKLELEQTTRGRMDTQISRLKEAIEKLNHECDSLRVKVGLLVIH